MKRNGAPGLGNRDAPERIVPLTKESSLHHDQDITHRYTADN